MSDIEDSGSIKIPRNVWKFAIGLTAAIGTVGGLGLKGLSLYEGRRANDQLMRNQLEILVRTSAAQAGVLYAMCVNQANMFDDVQRKQAMIGCQVARPPEDLIDALGGGN